MALLRYEGRPTNIKGAPTYEPLPNRPTGALNRRQKYDKVEIANNSIMEGWGPAMVNGKKTTGFYFRATDGSAQGIAWNGGMNVYRLPGTRDRYFADESRIGMAVMAQRVAARYIQSRRNPATTMANFIDKAVPDIQKAFDRLSVHQIKLLWDSLAEQLREIEVFQQNPTWDISRVKSGILATIRRITNAQAILDKDWQALQKVLDSMGSARVQFLIKSM